MPEASVDEDDKTATCEHEIRGAGQVLPVEPISGAERSAEAADHELRGGVAVLHARHHPASLCLGDRVGHRASREPDQRSASVSASAQADVSRDVALSTIARTTSERERVVSTFGRPRRGGGVSTLRNLTIPAL